MGKKKWFELQKRIFSACRLNIIRIIRLSNNIIICDAHIYFEKIRRNESPTSHDVIGVEKIAIRSHHGNNYIGRTDRSRLLRLDFNCITERNWERSARRNGRSTIRAGNYKVPLTYRRRVFVAGSMKKNVTVKSTRGKLKKKKKDRGNVKRNGGTKEGGGAKMRVIRFDISNCIKN